MQLPHTATYMGNVLMSNKSDGSVYSNDDNNDKVCYNTLYITVIDALHIRYIIHITCLISILKTVPF